MVIGHAGPVQSLEVLSFLVQHFQTVFLHSLVVHQLHLQQTGWSGRRGNDRRGGKVTDNTA